MNKALQLICAFALMCSANQQIFADRVAPGSAEYVYWMNQITIHRQVIKSALEQAKYAELLDQVDGISAVSKTRHLKLRLERLLEFYQSSLGIIYFLIRGEEPTRSERKLLWRYAKKITMLSLAITELDSSGRSESLKKRKDCVKALVDLSSPLER